MIGWCIDAAVASRVIKKCEDAIPIWIRASTSASCDGCGTGAVAGILEQFASVSADYQRGEDGCAKHRDDTRANTEHTGELGHT